MDLARLAASVESFAASTVRVLLYAALFLTPLLITSPDAMFGYADVPKVAAARVFAGLIAAAWMAHAAAGVVISGRRPGVPAVFARNRWIGASAGLFLAAAAVSAVFAVSLETAIFGAYPGYDSTDLYSLAAYLVTGASAARFLQSRRHLETVLGAVALAGSLASAYGIAQAAGLDPFHFDRFEVNDGRSPLTFGNPAFAGSFLAMSLLMTVGLFLLQERPLSRPGLLAYAAILLQAAALSVSASRGAWIGTAAGSTLLVLLVSPAYRGAALPICRRHLVMLGMLVVAAAAAGGVLLVADAGTSNAADRLQSFNSGLPVSGLNGRGATWSSTLEMIGERPGVGKEAPGGALITFPGTGHLFGYGPDNYRYAYQQVAPDEHAASFVPHAHNSFLNITAELGIAGLLAWTSLTVAVVAAGVTVTRDRKAIPGVRLMAAAATAAFVAHAVDQLVNVPRASDSLLMWSLAGMIAALAVLRTRGSEAEDSSSNRGQTERKKTAGTLSGTAFFAPPLAIAAIAAVVVLTVAGNAGHILADRAAASLQSELLQGARVSDIAETADRASSLAGDVAHYHALEASALSAAASAAASAAVASPALQRRLMERSLEAREASVSAIPLSPVESLSYAAALLDSGRYEKAVERYEVAVSLAPRYWAAWLGLAGAYAVSGEVEQGVAALRRAESLIGRQAESTQQDPDTVRQFEAVRSALGSG